MNDPCICFKIPYFFEKIHIRITICVQVAKPVILKLSYQLTGGIGVTSPQRPYCSLRHVKISFGRSDIHEK